MANYSDSYHALLGLPPLPDSVQSPNPEVLEQRAAADARDRAASIIQKAWKSFTMRMTFKWLKENLLRAERSMTMEILKRLSPKEAELMKDPVVQAKVRFRFGGSTFPPTIMFKIYTKSNSVHYYSGHRLIQADTQAAVDSCTIMGVRVYYENMLRNENQNRALKISHADEVTNRMEFVQYVNSLDHKPAYLGGRNNGWRELGITPLLGLPDLVFDMRSRKSTRLSKRNGGIPTFMLSASQLKNSSNKPQGNKTRKSQRNRRARGDNGSPSRLNEEVELDDDFDPLFEWANLLSFDSLEDYKVREITA